MEKIALISDTTADLSDEIIKKYNIKVLSFRILYKDREYIDKVNITPQQVYESLQNEVPTSSMPSIQDMEDLYTKLEEEGYTHVIAVVLSSGLSGIYNGICMVSNNHPGIISHICDSRTISMAEGAIAIEVGKLIEKNKSFSEIVDALPSIKKRIHLFFLVGTLEYLKKGGRIGRVSGTIAELLDIKPIISAAEDGKYYTYAKVRGRKQSLNKITELGKEILDQKKCDVYVMNGDALEDSKRVFEVLKKHPNTVYADFGGTISPVSGVHTGPGLVGLVLVEEE